MRSLRLFALVLLLSLAHIFAPAPIAAAEEPTIVYRGARILTAAGAPIDKGVLIVRKDKIVAVGADSDTPIPEGAEVIDLTGKTIIPGLVDTHSHIGIWPRPHVAAHNDGNEGSGPVQSALRGAGRHSAGRSRHSHGRRRRRHHGQHHARLGQRHRRTDRLRQAARPHHRGDARALVHRAGRFEDGQWRKSQALELRGPQDGPGHAHEDRRLAARAVRQGPRLSAAVGSAIARPRPTGKDATQPEVDLALEPLVEVLERKRTVHFHSHRADDLMTAIRLAKEFDFELVLQHCTEGYRIVEELVREKIPVSLTLVDSPGGKLEVAGLLEENAAILDKAGVKVAINTDDSITESRFLLRTGAIAVRGGMSEDAALRALTLHGAQMLHLDDRLGSLEKGKDADFVVLSGAPFSVYTQVLQTYIDGKCVFDRSQAAGLVLSGGRLRSERARAAAEDARRRSSRLPPSTRRCAAWNTSRGGATCRASPSWPDASKRSATESISNGVILVEDGKIKAVGSASDVKVPDGWPVLTAAVVTPGLIDAHTVVGLSGAANVSADQDQDEMSDPNQADLRVMDSFNPREPLLEFLCREGVTVVHAVPGRANVIAGQTGIFRTSGRTAESMALRFPAGLLVNLGETPKSSYPNRQPTTRMGTAALLRTALAQAQNHARKAAAAKSEDKRPPHNPKLEALALALDGKVPVIFAAHRADDLCTALRLAKEFKLMPRLDLATEGYLIADRLAEAKVPVVVHPTMQRPGSMETYHSQLCNAAVLADHKIPLAIGTGFEAYVPKTRVLRHEAAMAMVNGLGYDRALRAITLDAAHILGIDKQRGSIEKGKVADLVLFDGDPFEHATHVTHTLIDGRVVYDRGEYLQLPFARRAIPLTGSGGVGCCLGIW